MTSVDFLEFFTQLSLAAKADSTITASKGSRKQVYNSEYVTMPTYTLTYGNSLGSEVTSLTVGELCIAPQNFIYYLFLDNEYELEPDDLATGDNYDTALNFFQEVYNERRDLLVNRIVAAKATLEKNNPDLILRHDETSS